MTDAPRNIDGVLPADTPKAAAMPGLPAPSTELSPAARRWVVLLPTVGGGAALLYMLWCVVLLVLLPDASGRLQGLVSVGVVTALAGALVYLLVAGIGVVRISASRAAMPVRTRSLIRLAIVLIPGILLSAAVPLLITREPRISLDIVKPVSAEEFIAPLSIDFSLEKAIATLGLRGLKPVQYQWDLDADGKPNDETVVPALTVTYDRDGVYTVAVRILLTDGTARTVSRRFIIRQAVFTVQPLPPIVDQPVVFDISNVLSETNVLKQVEWDFESDGTVEETVKSPDVTYTFFKTGTVKVTALVSFTNNTQVRYERSIEVTNPPALAFPATLVTEPMHLISPPPFGVRLSVQTEEPLAQVQWNFGDGDKGEGQTVAHTFTKKGSFPVTARVRSKSGSIVELSSVVQVVDMLNLSDLRYEGTPSVSGERMSGEVPLTLNLRPRTSVPFVTFVWEAPEATEVGSTEETLQAIYRRDGTYNVTLIAQDAQQHVLRKVFTVEVRPQSSDVQFLMRPESGVAPLTVVFDASESFVPGEEITGYEWSFGDRNPREPGSARMQHTYMEPGTYVVDLTVRTVSGKDFTASKTIVVRPSLLTSCFKPSRSTLKAGGGVSFDSACSKGQNITFQWDFGDGSQTDERSPIHLYEFPGTYTVVLTVRDASFHESVSSATIKVE